MTDNLTELFFGAFIIGLLWCMKQQRDIMWSTGAWKTIIVAGVVVACMVFVLSGVSITDAYHPDEQRAIAIGISLVMVVINFIPSRIRNLKKK